MPRSSVPGILSWHQCDLISQTCCLAAIEASVDRKPEYIGGETILCILSQDCDIVADDRKEPFIDLLAGRIINKIANDYTNSRNPRYLDVESEGKALRFSIHDRFSIPKVSLSSVYKEMSFHIGVHDKNIIQRWISRRYIRAAFPDAFNERLSNSGIGKLLKDRISDDVSILLIHVTNEELQDREPYHVDIIIGIKDNLTADIKDRIERSFDAALSSPGIVVDSLRLSTEDDITYKNLRIYKRLEVDFRSLPENPEKAVPPAGL